MPSLSNSLAVSSERVISTGSAGSGPALLLESGFYLLLEDGVSHLLLEP
jgi:hypothetical protein